MHILLALFLSIFSYQILAFEWQGHRGARGIYPENTVSGMLEALKYPVTTLEMDVVVSKDQQVVVSHDLWMNPKICLHPEAKPYKEKEIILYKLNYQEIEKFDCGSKPHENFPQQFRVAVKKPLLRDLLKTTEKAISELEDRAISYSIEIKSTPMDEKSKFQPLYKAFADLVVKEILAILPANRFYIQSFDWRVLKYLKQAYPEIRLVALRESSYKASEIEKELSFRPDVFSPHYQLLTKDDVNFFHQQIIKVIPWTVNTVDEMEKLIDFGIDGIITDYPNLISSVNLKNCRSGYNSFEGRCVKIPKNAAASSSNPGWVCNPAYVQKRKRCIKISIPKNAHFLEDGKTWVCNEGFHRYRDKCKENN